MYRPRLLSRVTSWLTMPPPAPIADHAMRSQAGRAFIASDPADGPVGYLTVMARAYATDAVAFHAARTLVDDAGTIDPAAAIAVAARAERTLALPGAEGVLVSWHTFTHQTGRSAAWAAAIVRHGEMVWEITASGRRAHELAEAVVSLAATLGDRLAIDGDRLFDLLPGLEDLPEPMTPDAAFTVADDEVALAA